MKEKLLHNLGLKILSIVIALIMWLMIMNGQDPTITATVDNIPVVVINEEVVTSRGYSYTIESGELIAVKVKGRRSIVNKLLASDFRAEADFKTLNSMNMASISLECLSEYADELVVEARTDTMAVKLEEQETKAISLKVVKNGNVKEGYFLFGETTETGIIQVTGAASQVARVKEVVAEIDISGIMSSTTFKPELYVVDIDGEKIDSKKISIKPDTVEVSVKVCPIKTVPVAIKPVNSVADGYYLSNIEFAPSEISIAADVDTLAKIETIELEVPVTGFKENREVKVDASTYIENRFGERCVIVGDNKTISVLVEVKLMAQKRIDIYDSNIEVRGKNEDKYDYKLSREFDSSVFVKGSEEMIENVEAADLGIYIDVSSLEPGHYTSRLMTSYVGELKVECGRITIDIMEKVNDTPVVNTVYYP